MRQKFSTQLRCTAAFAALTCTMFSSAVAAQEIAPAADAPENDEIIVTAQRREERLIDVPVSVAAVTGAQLANAGVRSTDDLVLVTPSLSVNRHLAPFQTTIRIRGVGTSVTAPTIESSVSMVVDGVVIANQSSFFTDLFDINRLEVLRGPQSTLFGKNAAAGAVNISTANPSLTDYHGAFEANLNDYEDLTLRGTVSGPLSQNVGASLTFSYLNGGDPAVQNISTIGPDLGNDKSIGVRGKIYWEIDERLSFKFIGDYRDAEGPNSVRTPTRFESLAVQNLYGVGPVDYHNRKVNINGGPDRRHFYDNQDKGVSGQFDLEFDNASLTSITAFRQSRSNTGVDVDGLGNDATPSGYDDPVVISGVGSVQTGRFSLIGSSYVDARTKSEQFSQELRLASSGDTRLRYVAGLFYWHTNLEYDSRQLLQICPLNTAAPGFVPPRPIIGDGDPNALTGRCTFPPPAGVAQSARTVFDVTTDYYAAFGQLDFDLTDKLTALIGARFQREDYAYSIDGGLGGASLYAGTTPSTAPFSGKAGVRNDRLTGKASLSYKPNSNLNTYLSYARGYKGPGLDSPPNLSAFVRKPLEPETVDAYELGLKARIPEQGLSLNLALFWQDIKNFQEPAYDPETATVRAINAGASRQKGIEAELGWRPTSRFDLSVNAVYLDSEYTDFKNADCYTPRALNTRCQYTLITGAAAAGRQDVTGSPTVFSPKLSLTASAGYELPIGSDYSLMLRGDFRHVSRQQSNSNQDPDSWIPSYQVVNLRFGLKFPDEKTSLTFYVNNLFDESYSVFRRSYNYSGQVNPNGNTILDVFPKDANRNFGLTFRTGF